jgi:hypothetical protein
MLRLVLGQVAGLTILVVRGFELQLVVAGGVAGRTVRAQVDPGELKPAGEREVVDVGIVPF